MDRKMVDSKEKSTVASTDPLSAEPKAEWRVQSKVLTTAIQLDYATAVSTVSL